MLANQNRIHNHRWHSSARWRRSRRKNQLGTRVVVAIFRHGYEETRETQIEGLAGSSDNLAS